MTNEYCVSDIFPSGKEYEVIDGKYNDIWRYATASVVRFDRSPLPANGNTTIFRILPGGMTEPMLMTAKRAVFSIKGYAGNGALLRARNSLTTSTIISQYTNFEVRPGDAFCYINTSPDTDLVLRDTAIPAFQTGDEYTITDEVMLGDKEFHTQLIAGIPPSFFEAVGRAMRQ